MDEWREARELILRRLANREHGRGSLTTGGRLPSEDQDRAGAL